ncbi:Variant SH3 [Penicillium chermesinum]|uniref:Peroxisomal membrane protein PEX13 n=1 Tax=Penicillium chermesinum TaxID=63820 RepID=A0A9W9P1N1_9EURO|nr:Variant SH3 [Penicillium chermesinum]KAJ5232482.1 Variant SH3 [Penicillium chermesinum]
MASVSPPKPWERAGAASGNALSTTPTAGNPVSSTAMTTTSPAAGNPAPSATSTAPDLPSRPSTLNSVVNSTASNYSPYGASRLGASPYGGYGGMGAYSRRTPVSAPWAPCTVAMVVMAAWVGCTAVWVEWEAWQDPNDPNSLTNSFGQSTQATFQMIESIVGAFGGFAQMLESTYMATHSSFFAMVSVAEQFGNLRNTLGSALGIFAVIRWFRTLIAKITGRPPPADATSLTPAAFAAFMGGRSSSSVLPDGSPAPAKPSKKPFFMFLIAVFGLPYLMGKLIRSLARSQEEEAKRRQQLIGPNGEPHSASMDPAKLDFCRVLYDYSPETQESNGIDLAVSKGDIVAVLSKSDPMGNASEWWRCRARDGRVGYLPGPYLETIQRRPQQAITGGSEPASRTSTMKDGGHDRTQSLSALSKPAGDQPPELKSKVGDISPESFQKSTFYS